MKLSKAHYAAKLKYFKEISHLHTILKNGKRNILHVKFKNILK